MFILEYYWAALLSLFERRKLFLIAVAAIVFAMLLTGVSIATKVPLLKPWPGPKGVGTEADPIMKAVSYAAIVGAMATVFKVAWVPLLGPWLERKFDTNRAVRIRHVFNGEIFWMALWGGLLQAIWTIGFIGLVTVIAPSAIAAGRTLAILPIVAIELVTRVIKRGNRRKYMRLAASIAVTFVGAFTAIFANGFDLFIGESDPVYFWLFIGMLSFGNFFLALAEQAELHGVKKPNTAGAVYTLARFVYFTLTCVVGVVVCGVVRGSWSVVTAMFDMLTHRPLLIVPIALLGGAADLLRICVKTIVSATFMYQVWSFAVVVEGIIQTIGKWKWPEIYDKVPGTASFVFFLLVGGSIIVVGAFLHPPPEGEQKQKPTLEPVLQEAVP